MTHRPRLRALADRVGILTEYLDMGGTPRRTTDAARVALLSAMGYDASTETACDAALSGIESARAARLIPAVRVAPVGRPPSTIVVTLPAAVTGTVSWRIEATDEQGRTTAAAGTLHARGGRRTARLAAPATPSPGYTTVHVSVTAGGLQRSDEQLLIVTPDSCYRIDEALRGRRGFGILTNLYAVRDTDDWGVGDVGHLRRLGVWSAQLGADFVGINPLHALRNRGGDVSPYAPVTRLFRNPLYLDVTAVPELAASERARRLLDSTELRRDLERLREAQRIQYEPAMRAKRRVLERLHDAFVEHHRDRDTGRGRAYAAYLDREGNALTDFATFMAIDDLQTGGNDTRRAGPATWSPEYHDARSDAVRRFRDEHAGLVDFHRFLQFELDRQIERAARRLERAGMAVGLFGDLAIGSARSGSDVWGYPDLFLPDLEIGAPPDDFAPEGQAWGIPPLDPLRLRARAFDYWIRVVRAALRHMGGLRIDHVMGLFRQFWIPRGRPGTEGAYIRFPAAELLAVLAVESMRHRAVIVGEDLGTVPRGLASALRRWEILSTRVLYFEQGRRGAFCAARRYSRRALVTANTHDQVPLAGFADGTDLRLRRAAGAIPDDATLDRALSERRRDYQALLRRLSADGASRAGVTLTDATYRFLALTPAPLLGVSLADLAGEREPVNLPGVSTADYPSWTCRLGRPLGSIMESESVRSTLREVARRRRRRP